MRCFRASKFAPEGQFRPAGVFPPNKSAGLSARSCVTSQVHEAFLRAIFCPNRASSQCFSQASGASRCYARAPSSFLFMQSARYPQNATHFVIFARILANAPPPHDTLRACFVCATHAHSHFCPQHWLLCHLGLY